MNFLAAKGRLAAWGKGQAQGVDGEGVYCLPALCLRFARGFLCGQFDASVDDG